MAEPETAEEFIARKQLAWESERDRLSIWTKDIGRRGRMGWAREAWTFQIQHDYRVKVIVLERLRVVRQDGERAYQWDGGEGAIQYRFGYWTLGRIGRAQGRWVWGQFSLLIPQQDLTELLSRARREGTLRSSD